MIVCRRRNRIEGLQQQSSFSSHTTPNSPAPSDSMPPRLITTGSNSSSSSGDSPPKKFKFKRDAMNRRRPMSRGRNRLPFRRPLSDPPGSKGYPPRHLQQELTRDSTILKGAEILRRELSDVNGMNIYKRNDDPWRNPAVPSKTIRKEERRHEEISELTVSADDAAYWAARPNLGQEIYEDVPDHEDYGGQVPPVAKEPQPSYNIEETKTDVSRTEEKKTDDSNMDKSNIASNNIADDDTISVLERAMNFLGSTARSVGASRVQSTPKPQLHKSQSEPPSLVQRVSDLDDNKSFASMFASTFLPQHLVQVSLVSQTSPPSVQEEEEMETSTLDYIANMYDPKADGKQANVPRNRTPSQTGPLRFSSSEERPFQGAGITHAAHPFERMVAPSSYYYDELMQDKAYQHAVQAGILWQSLCSQHVRFPPLWWDGDEPGSPPLGTPEKQSWRYLGRHRVKADRKMNALIGNRGSAGRILLHLIVRDDVTCEPVEDICCGSFHPNARGIRTTPTFDPDAEDCRDVWIGHRRRFQGPSLSTLEALLKRQNKNRVFASPLGGPKSSASDIRNGNLKAAFGEKPPLFTVFVTESEIFELIRSEANGGSPVSVVLLRRYLRYRIG